MEKSDGKAHKSESNRGGKTGITTGAENVTQALQMTPVYTHFPPPF